MKVARRSQSLSAAAPWIVAAVLFVAAWVAFRGGNQVPTDWATKPARSTQADPVRPGRAPSSPASDTAGTPPAASPAVTVPLPESEPVSPPGTDDVAELRRRQLPIPVEGVAAAMLVPTFHQPRAGHEHEALDILAPRGTPAIAVEDGDVAKLFTSKQGGLTVYLFDSSGTYCYYYAHLDSYADGLRDGQHVVRGEVVGYVGTTGNAPPNTPHLHFAVFKLGPDKHWWQGTPIDPYLIWR
jgi:murein DD-endopeptidase MepM/ murein hydrolase activator NlpD